MHLGRLAAFYPACRQCPHRDQTGTLSPRQVEQLQEVRSSNQQRSLFHDEGAGGVYLNELTPVAARNIAAAFGIFMRDEGRGTRGEGNEELFIPPSPFPLPPSSNPQSPIPNPSVLLAGDGRAITAELSAAVGEGLRFSGCDVLDIGPATAACLAFAVHHCEAAGGILVGNPGEQPHIVGLQFWAAGPRPLSAGGSLEPIAELYQAGVDRPARNYGAICRIQADVPYLAAIQEHYHALRPLRVVVDSASKPLVEYLQKLTATVACQVIPCRVARRDLPEQVRADAAHFAVCVDGDGETCRVLDEQGQVVSAERLLLLLARRPLQSSSYIKPRPVVAPHPGTTAGRGFSAGQSPAIVLEEATPSATIDKIKELGGGVAIAGARRAEMAAAMSQRGAALGGGPSGRFWHRTAGVPLPDALMTVTRLLILLSRGDEPLSTVLDREAVLR